MGSLSSTDSKTSLPGLKRKECIVPCEQLERGYIRKSSRGCIYAVSFSEEHGKPGADWKRQQTEERQAHAVF